MRVAAVYAERLQLRPSPSVTSIYMSKWRNSLLMADSPSASSLHQTRLQQAGDCSYYLLQHCQLETHQDNFVILNKYYSQVSPLKLNYSAANFSLNVQNVFSKFFNIELLIFIFSYKILSKSNTIKGTIIVCSVRSVSPSSVCHTQLQKTLMRS